MSDGCGRCPKCVSNQLLKNIADAREMVAVCNSRIMSAEHQQLRFALLADLGSALHLHSECIIEFLQHSAIYGFYDPTEGDRLRAEMLAHFS